LYLDSISNTASEACFRLDVCVPDETRLVLAFHHEVRLGKRFFNVSANHSTAHQNIPFTMRVQAGRIRSQRLIDCLERR
jgi:hypothetical protein